MEKPQSGSIPAKPDVKPSQTVDQKKKPSQTLRLRYAAISSLGTLQRLRCAMMNRLKAISASLRFVDSSLATRVLATRNQVTHFSSRTLLPLLGRSHNFCFPDTHQKLYLSSKPNSIVELVLTNDWSQGVEHELEKCRPSLTHETVLYVLKQLDKNPEKASCFFNWVSKREWFRASSSVFSLILRVLANKEMMKQFWITLRTMKERGFYLDEETYRTILTGFKKAKMNSDCAALTHFYYGMLKENAMQSVVVEVVDIISFSEPEWNEGVESKLAKRKIQLTDNFVIRVLKELRNSPLKAYKFFHWVGKQSGYQHNTVTYNAIARVLARSDSTGEFWSIIEEMKSEGHELDIDTYIKISRQLQKFKMLEDAVKLYELMMDGSYKPSVQDCSILLNSIAATEKPNLDLVFRIAKKFVSAGHTLSKAIYDGAHRSLTRAGKFDKAEDVVKAMRNASFEPDNITYSQLVFGLCKAGRLEEACTVLEEMEYCGCIPDINTWTILIQGHCDANEVANALPFLGKMLEKGFDVDACLLDVLVDGLLSQRRIDGVYKLLVEVVNNCRGSPRHGTYEKLIDNLLGIGKFEEALDLVCLMRKHKYTPLIQPVVRFISKSGTVEDAVKFLKAWSKGSPQSHSAYLHVFESLIKEGRLSEAKDLLCKCPSRIRRRKQIRDFFAFVEN